MRFQPDEFGLSESHYINKRLDIYDPDSDVPWTAYFSIWFFVVLLTYLPQISWCLIIQDKILLNGYNLVSSILLDHAFTFSHVVLIPVLVCHILYERRVVHDVLVDLLQNLKKRESRSHLLQEIRRLYRKSNRIVFACSIICGLAFVYIWNFQFLLSDGKITWQTFGSLFESESLNIIGKYEMFAGTFLIYFLIATAFGRYISHTVILSKVVQIGIKVNVYHPDGLGGLSMVGRLIKISQPIIVITGIGVALHFHLQSIQLGNESLTVLNFAFIGVYLLFCLVMFILPLIPFNRIMKTTRKKEYTRLLKTVVDKGFFKGETDIYDYSQERLGEIKQFREYFTLIQSMPVWPNDFKTLKSFLSALAAPVIGLLISILIRLFDKSV